MSTEQRVIDADRAALLSQNTVRQSQALTEKDRSLEPEDDRTRRFGYQPAFPNIEMHARESGQHNGFVRPAWPVLFESFWHKGPNPSVDADDPSGPTIDIESLPGKQVANLIRQYGEFGFRELRTLRGLDDHEMVDIFFEAHPPLSFAVAQEIRRPDGRPFASCLYETEDVDPKTGRREVCITCRRDLVDALLASEPTDLVKALLLELKESIRVGRSKMASEWAKVLSELQTKPNPGMAPTLGSLKDDHYYFMRQLHERTPAALEMEKSRQATIDTANIFKQAIGEQTAAITEGTKDDAIAEMRAELAESRREREELAARLEAKEEPPAKTPEASAKGAEKKDRK